MKKKILSCIAFLIVAVLTLSFIGCGKSNEISLDDYASAAKEGAISFYANYKDYDTYGDLTVTNLNETVVETTQEIPQDGLENNGDEPVTVTLTTTNSEYIEYSVKRINGELFITSEQTDTTIRQDYSINEDTGKPALYENKNVDIVKYELGKIGEQFFIRKTQYTETESYNEETKETVKTSTADNAEISIQKIATKDEYKENVEEILSYIEENLISEIYSPLESFATIGEIMIFGELYKDGGNYVMDGQIQSFEFDNRTGDVSSYVMSMAFTVNKKQPVRAEGLNLIEGKNYKQETVTVIECSLESSLEAPTGELTGTEVDRIWIY